MRPLPICQRWTIWIASVSFTAHSQRWCLSTLAREWRYDLVAFASAAGGYIFKTAYRGIHVWRPKWLTLYNSRLSGGILGLSRRISGKNVILSKNTCQFRPMQPIGWADDKKQPTTHVSKKMHGEDTSLCKKIAHRSSTFKNPPSTASGITTAD